VISAGATPYTCNGPVEEVRLRKEERKKALQDAFFRNE
jgi:hypothetical protein